MEKGVKTVPHPYSIRYTPEAENGITATAYALKKCLLPKCPYLRWE